MTMSFNKFFSALCLFLSVHIYAQDKTVIVYDNNSTFRSVIQESFEQEGFIVIFSDTKGANGEVNLDIDFSGRQCSVELNYTKKGIGNRRPVATGLLGLYK